MSIIINRVLTTIVTWDIHLIAVKIAAFIFRSDTYVHECSVDVVGALPIDGDQEWEAAVRWQDIHAAVLLVVSRQQGDAAVLHPQRGCHHIQSLSC